MTKSLFSTSKGYSLAGSLPNHCKEGVWVGRVWLPASFTKKGVAGPHVVTVRNANVLDVSESFLTISALLRTKNPARAVREVKGRKVCTLDKLLENSIYCACPEQIQESTAPVLLAPNDVQSIKACGVTFAVSMLERVIEEKALGDPKKAEEIRTIVENTVGKDLRALVPGSEPAMALKEKLIEEGVWSQYMEVGIGPDAEVFTKSQPLSAITTGAQLGVLTSSEWNNPEPEIAVLVSPEGNIVGATLGNDVNLRDVEGRSALLLGKAKDQNGTCCLGPFFRLFDESFSIEDIKSAEVRLEIEGEDGFRSVGANKMNEISRSIESLVEQVRNRSHQYPDGFVLFLGTMFAPTEDRGEPGLGFTHKVGDRVEISSPMLGKLVNWVNYCHEIPEWRYGITDLIEFATKVADA
jgi:fumarylacetoacetate (FAA) hydrolase family protein